MIVLVTGAAGFIGSHVCKKLLKRGDTVIGVDNLNHYYDIKLKEDRLAILQDNPNFYFYKGDVQDRTFMNQVARAHLDITGVVHLAAQAGVRYSLQDPYTYIDANVMGTLVLFEVARQWVELKHMVYASSSSVYGANKKLPFAVQDPTDTPISLYAATKKTCELMGYTYSHLYKLPITGLRFFTVYGPWGRPDMAAFIFAKAILAGTEMPVFNQGKMRRNFTYVDDIVAGTVACLDRPALIPCHRVYNIGNDQSEDLMHYIGTLEKLLGKKANIRFEPLQQGDVKETIADISDTARDFGFVPKTNIQEGLEHFVKWYKEYYGV
jgi:UDP-glucuronate 4-epimerase